MVTRPSRLYLPKFDSAPPTIFEYLLARFPLIDSAVWRERLGQGKVTLSDGVPIDERSPYRHGLMVFYRKEVPSEPDCAEDPRIIYQDDEILVVDKPHGMPVTPSGDQVERSLLFRLQRTTGLADLDPVHRLDRDTAGLVLFTVERNIRAQYHRLFSEGQIEKEYLAIAHVDAPLSVAHWRIENRIGPGEPWFRQRITEGPVNAITDIELEGSPLPSGEGAATAAVRARMDQSRNLPSPVAAIEPAAPPSPGGRGLSLVARFRLFPKTGKKHQLRVHMASIGCPIIGDPLYPTITHKTAGQPPMQLLARRLAFTDPLTGKARMFTSERNLIQ